MVRKRSKLNGRGRLEARKPHKSFKGFSFRQDGIVIICGRALFLRCCSLFLQMQIISGTTAHATLDSQPANIKIFAALIPDSNLIMCLDKLMLTTIPDKGFILISQINLLCEA